MPFVFMPPKIRFKLIIINMQEIRNGFSNSARNFELKSSSNLFTSMAGFGLYYASSA